MVRRMQLAWAVAGALLAALALTLVNATPSQGQPGNEVTIVGIDKLDDDRNLPLLDAGKKGFSRGDLSAFVTPLLDPETDENIGRVAPKCLILRASRKGVEFSCNGTAQLEGGNVSFEGHVVFGLNGDGTSTLAITGGTDAYESAGGNVVVEELDDEDAQLTINIETK